MNLFSARLFGADAGHDLNRRSAEIHLLTDAAVSAAVLIAALVVGFTGWNWLDAVTAIGVGLVVAWSGIEILRQALRIALDAVPEGIDQAAVEAAMRQLPGVLNVHHVHIWALSTSQCALTAHVVRHPGSIDDLDWLHQAKQRLAELGIAHSTIQLEPPPQEKRQQA